jgi:hypothetical protein
MHAVVVKVRVPNFEEAVVRLREDVVPRVSQQPGFRAGYWLRPTDAEGLSLIVFGSEDEARTAAEQIQPTPGVTLESVDVREVVANA